MICLVKICNFLVVVFSIFFCFGKTFVVTTFLYCTPMATPIGSSLYGVNIILINSLRQNGAILLACLVPAKGNLQSEIYN